MAGTTKPDLTTARIWANAATGGDITDPGIPMYATGWQLKEVPVFPDFNFLQQQFTQANVYNNEQGINGWDTNTVYPINALVKGSDGFIYRALVQQSGNDPTSSIVNWAETQLGLKVDTSTTATMTALTGLVAGRHIVETAEFSTGNEGGGIYDVVLTSSVTPNARNIIIGIADALISFVLRIEEPIDYRQFGAVSDAIQILDASIDIGVNATTLNSPGSAFTSSDINKGVGIFNAGAGTDSLFTSIKSIISPTSVELNDAASTTVVSVKAQYGTDSASQIQGVIDFVLAAGSGAIVGIGEYFTPERIDYRADNCVYHLGGFTGYGKNHTLLDETPVTHQITDILGFGGIFRPLGDTKAFGGNVNFNGFSAVHAKNVEWYSAEAHTGDGTRAFSIQADDGHGTGPNFQNLKNVHFHNFKVFGDGLTHDGFDMTSGTVGTDMIQDCSITGTIEGVRRGVNNSPGGSTQRHVRIFIDAEITGASEVSARVQFAKDSVFKFRGLDFTKDCIIINGPENCDMDLFGTGSGAGVNDGILIADNGADTTNRVRVSISDDGTNKLVRAFLPRIHDLQVDSLYIDGATTAINNTGFRTVYSSAPVLKNFTTAITNIGAVQDAFASPIISLGTGSNPVELFVTETVSPGASFQPDTKFGLKKVLTVTEALNILNVSNAVVNQLISYTLIQDPTGGFAVTWNSNYKFTTAFDNTGNTANTTSTVAFRFAGDNTWREAEQQSVFQ